MFFTFNDQCQIFTSKLHYRKKRKYRPCSLHNSRKRQSLSVLLERKASLRFIYKPMIRSSSHFAVYCQKQGCFLVFRKLYYSGHDRLMAIFELEFLQGHRKSKLPPRGEFQSRMNLVTLVRFCFCLRNGSLTMVTCASSPVTHVSRSPLRAGKARSLRKRQV